MNTTTRALLLAAAVFSSSAATISTSSAASENAAPSASQACVPHIRGTYGIGLGNTPPFQDVTTEIADLPTNQVFQICNGPFKDRTEMRVIYSTVGSPSQSRRVERNSCFLFNAAQVKIRAIMGSGHTPPEDSVSGQVNVCKLP